MRSSLFWSLVSVHFQDNSIEILFHFFHTVSTSQTSDYSSKVINESNSIILFNRKRWLKLCKATWYRNLWKKGSISFIITAQVQTCNDCCDVATVGQLSWTENLHWHVFYIFCGYYFLILITGIISGVRCSMGKINIFSLYNCNLLKRFDITVNVSKNLVKAELIWALI